MVWPIWLHVVITSCLDSRSCSQISVWSQWEIKRISTRYNMPRVTHGLPCAVTFIIRCGCWLGILHRVVYLSHIFLIWCPNWANTSSSCLLFWILSNESEGTRIVIQITPKKVVKIGRTSRYPCGGSNLKSYISIKWTPNHIQ